MSRCKMTLYSSYSLHLRMDWNCGILPNNPIAEISQNVLCELFFLCRNRKTKVVLFTADFSTLYITYNFLLIKKLLTIHLFIPIVMDKFRMMIT